MLMQRLTPGFSISQDLPSQTSVQEVDVWGRNKSWTADDIQTNSLVAVASLKCAGERLLF